MIVVLVFFCVHLASNSNFDLDNSPHHAQPHSIIANHEPRTFKPDSPIGCIMLNGAIIEKIGETADGMYFLVEILDRILIGS